jgi:hypothetical protein
LHAKTSREINTTAQIFKKKNWLRKAQHHRSSLKEEKPLQFIIPPALLPKNRNLFCEGKEG